MVHGPGLPRAAAGSSGRSAGARRRRPGCRCPQDTVFDAIERLHADLEEVHQILTGKDSSVRLVLTPETVVVAEARRALTTLSLFGYRVDGVVANRVFPDARVGRVAEQWVAAQAAVLARGRAVLRGAADLALGVPCRASRWASRSSPRSPRRRTASDDPLAAAARARGR